MPMSDLQKIDKAKCHEEGSITFTYINIRRVVSNNFKPKLAAII